MGNWYKNIKKARFRGLTEPTMDYYSRGERPYSSNYQKDPRSLVTAIPEFGGNSREGYPDDMNSFESEPSENYKNKRTLPGEPVLMDDGGDGEGANKQQFVAEEDKIPIGDEESRRLDRGRRDKSGLPIKEKNIFKKVRNQSGINSLNRF